MSLGWVLIIFIYLLLFSHLTVDKSFPKNVKIGSYIVFGLLAVVYIAKRIIW